ncbi:MAG: replication protein, partial [Cytophagaceae bacterium]
MPAGREVIEQMRKGRLSRQQLALIQGGRAGRLIGFSGRRLPWHRLEDLRALIIRRGKVKEGLRMRFLFWFLNFLVLSGACNSTTLYYEAAELAKEIDPTWNYRSQELMTLYSKAKAFAAGERVEFNGRRYPSLYTPRNDTLIDLFEITTDEQRGLPTIISPEMAL